MRRRRAASARARRAEVAGPREDEARSGGDTPDLTDGHALAPARKGRFGLDLGNPIERESAAFSWLIVVIVAAISVGLVGKLISPLAAAIWVIILLGIVSVPVFRGIRHQLGSPEDDE